MNNAFSNVEPDSGKSSVAQLRSRGNLTQNQLGFWLGQRVAQTSTVFNMGQLYRFDIDIDPSHLDAAVSTMISHSDALRTQFREVDGIPEQVVAADVLFDLPIIDLSAESDVEQKLADWCAERISIPFQINERCFDFALLKIAEDSWVWYLCIHHIVIDGTSVDLIFRYVEELYQLSQDGRLHEAVKPPQFAAYVEKEKKYRESASCRADEKFWNERPAIDGASTTFYGHQRKTDSNQCVREGVKLGHEHTELLLDTVVEVLGAGTSADLDLLTGYLALLAAYKLKAGGGNTLAVGVPFHNRVTQAEKRIVGLVMEVVSIRIAVCSEDTFSTLLKKARTEIRSVLRHYRFGGTNAAREKSYDIMLNLVPTTTNEFASGGVQTQWIHSGQWNEAMTLQVQHTSDGSILYFDLNQELFPHGLAARVPEHFLTLSKELLSTPDCALESLSLLSDSEREVIGKSLRLFGNAAVAEETIVSRFEDVATHMADSIAVIGASGSTTYQELNEDANRIARHLLSLGISGNEHIGICLPRTVDRITGILAILKSGGAYVPIDETWPSARTSMAIEDATVGLVITNAATAKSLKLGSDIHLLIVDECAEEINRHSSESPAGQVMPNDIAYINFTSGSTGRPKGVLVPNAGVIRLVAEPNYTNWSSTTVMMHLSSISFDAATFELWGPLLNGGKLVLPSRPLPSGESIKHDIQRYGVNTLFLTTSLFNALVDDDPSVFVGVEEFLTGGEAASPSHFAKFSKALPDARLLNCYGPTECTVIISTYAFSGEERPGEPIPIGKPISGTFVHVLDERHQDVPIGAVGELYAGGPGLAHGYVGQPALTKSRFMQMDGPSEVRMYKTGDFVRITDDGNLVFVGRRDNQVKVRGFLIELDEIELAVNSLPEVSRAVVSVCQAQDATNGLAAYVVPSRKDLTVGELRAGLRQMLPEKMMPRWYVLSNVLPLGTSGKVDRSLLPHPDSVKVELEVGEASDLTVTESQLAVIWRDLLRLDLVGLDDNFFELGGDSIVAIQLASRGSKIGLCFDAQDVFENPTVRSLAGATKSSDVVASGTSTDDTPVESDRFASSGLTGDELSSVFAELGLEESLTHKETQRSVSPDAVEDIYPLTPLQEGMLFHSVREPNKGLYCVQTVWEFHGSISADACRAALADVVSMHSVLRTAFSWRHGGRPVQIVLKNVDVPLCYDDWQSINDNEREELFEQELVADRALDFDLVKPPLMRARLIAWADGEYRLIWTVHHILLDGWSWGIVTHDFLQSLAARTDSKEPALISPRPFKDYIDWISRQDSDAAKVTWRDELAGLTTPTYLVTRAEVTATTSTADFPDVSLKWDFADEARLRDFGRRERVTLSTLLQAAWAQVLTQYTRETDVVFGATTVSRPAALSDCERIAGLFINTLPVRVRNSAALAAEPETLRDFQKTQATLRHQSHVSLAEISTLNSAAAPDGLFNSIMVFENYPDNDLIRNNSKNLQVVDYQIHDKTNYPLTLVVLPDEALQVKARYNPDYHSRADVEALLEALRSASLTLLSGPNSSQEVSMDDKAPVRLNEPDPFAPLIHEQFRLMAAKFPDRPAVTYEGRSMTYQALDEASDIVALGLISSGVHSGDYVGVCMSRSADIIKVLLGILKAGAAYVPLDPSYPKDRLLYSLSDSGCVSVVTNKNDRASLQGSSAVELFYEDLVQAQTGLQDRIAETLASVEVSADSLAYVIYTSGSTGNPKGVMVTHANVNRLFTSTTDWFNFGHQDVWTLFHSYAFDFSVWEIWGALLYGGRLVVVPYWTTRDATKFLELLRIEKVTILNQTPSAFKQLIRADEQTGSHAPASQLRYVIFGGEALDFASLRSWLDRHAIDAPQLINMYGITETTVHVTWHCITADEILRSEGSNIGIPIPDLEIYLLDKDLNPVGSGAAGEIVVGGAGVAAGYLNRPELTAEKFINDPLNPQSGRRFYRSGDTARRRSDGTLEYIGRIDNQLKIRGFRIEPGEIEHVLSTHESIAECAVIARSKEDGEKTLAAYYVTRQSEDLPIAVVKSWIDELLPKHMVPEVFVALDVMPLTENGKIDRKRLPSPARIRTNAGRAPKSEVERRLMAIWEKILDDQTFSVDDSFFDVGGNSILSMQLAAQVSKEFEQEVPVVAIYEAPTIEKLAVHLSGEEPETDVLAQARARVSRRAARGRIRSAVQGTENE